MVLRVWVSVLLVLLPGIAWAHDDACSCHHWENPAYIGELHLQLILMAAAALLLVAARLVTQAVRKRSASV